MNGNKTFHNFIGKNIKEFKIAKGEQLSHNPVFNKYSTFIENGNDFYGKTYHDLTIRTNDEDIITSITIYLQGEIDKTFYSAFNGYYGQPDEILIVDYVKRSISTEEAEDKTELTSTVVEENYFLKKGKFKDKPRKLIWNKENYQINIFVRYDDGITEVNFMLPKK